MKLSKLCVVLILLFFIPVFLFAKGNAENKTETQEGPITIDVWYALSGTSGEAFMKVVDDFNALDNGITVNASYSGGYGDTATKITAALRSNTTPDALIGGQVTYSGAYGNFFSGDKAQSDKEFNFDDVFPGLWQYGIYNGRICNIPYGMSTNTMFYNKELVDAAGIDLVKNPPKTWDDFMKVCEKLKDFYKNKEGFIPFVVQDEDWLSNTQIMQCGNPVISANKDYSVKSAAWGSPECAKVAAWWQEMVKKGLMDMTKNQNGNNVFSAGNAAFFAGSSTKISEWSKTMGSNLQAIEMPYFDVQKVALGGNTLSIFPKDDKRSEAAWTFVKYITSADKNAEFAVASGYLPIRKSAFNSPAVVEAIQSMPAYAVAFKQLGYADAYINIDDYAAKAIALASFRTAVTKDLGYDPLKAMQESAKRYNDETK